MMTNHNTSLLELKGFQISQIAADPIGRCVALCGTDELVICPLKHPSQYSAFSLPSKLGCSGLAWHPNDHTKLAIARSNKCELLLWDVNECRLSTNTSLGGYVRVINSLDWSPVHPFLIATTSADQFRAICVWDLRDMSRPVRSVESLSSPVIVKWNRFLSEKFATCHSSGVRTWDLRSNVPEQYISVQADHVRDFDWSPQNVNQMVTVSEYSEMRLWDTENPSYPLKKVRFHEIKLKKVIYTPSGDHIIILPEQSHWSVHGISVWSSAGLTQSHDLFQVMESHDNSDTNNNEITVNKTPANSIVNSNNNNGNSNNNPINDQQICQPRSTDSYILDMNWLICSSSNLPFSPLTTTDDHELTTNFILDNEISIANQNLEYCPKKNIHLLTWSMDNILRVYPIHFKSISHHDNEPLSNQANKQTRIIKEKSEDLLDDKLSTNFNPKTNQSKKFSNTSTNNLNKLKVVDPQHRGEDFGQRSSVYKSCLSISKSGLNADPKCGNQEDSAFQFLAQELSLLSHRAGQYKLEEMDLINRTAKLILFYCRRNHHHHYSLCSVTNTLRRRRHSSVMNNEGLDSLLLPPTADLISQMEFSEHSNFWKAHHRNLSSTTDTERTISNRTSISNSAVSVDNEESTHLTNYPSNHPFTLTFDNSHELENSTTNNTHNYEMPLAGSIILSIEFPDNYPLNGAIPEFHVLDCSPPLPPEVLDELKDVLYSTASELVSTSRGCVEPCIRNAVITLQTYPTLSNQIENNSKKLNLTNLSTTNYDMLNVNMDTLNKPIIDTTASMKQKCHYTIGIPFPRTSGVHFTTNGLIVTFGLPESLSFIRNSIKSTSSDDKCQVELTNNNNNDTKKDWTPQSFNEYQTFIQRFSSANREYNDDMRRSFQNCIGNIIDSFARFEVDCKEQQRQQHQPHKKQKIITELIDKNRLLFKMNVELNQNSMNSTANDAEVKKNSFESARVTEQKWFSSISTTHPNSPDVQNPTEMFLSHFSMIYPSTIQIYDMSPLIWDRHLMYDYSLNTENLQQMCIHNLHAVYNTHRKDLIRFWQYALVMSISLSHTDHSHQVYQPLASQLIGRPLFDTWIRHFLRIHDVQSLAMLVLVLQSLNHINELKFDKVDGSNISLNKLENTITSLSSVNNFLETYSLYHMNESEKTINLLGCNTVASSSLEQQVSFTLDNSDETQSEFSLVSGQSNENMNGCPIEQLPPKELSINSICAYQSRFVHPKDLLSFDHYIYVYASIIYSLREYILHAHLLRSWSYNIRTNSFAHIWPYVQTNAMILLSCPDMRCSSNLVPKHSNGSLKSAQCTHCQWEVNLENQQSTTGPQKPQRLLICTVCRNSCKGLVLVCPLCSHGGHVHHVSTWFNSVGRTNLPRQCPFINSVHSRSQRSQLDLSADSTKDPELQPSKVGGYVSTPLCSGVKDQQTVHTTLPTPTCQNHTDKVPLCDCINLFTSRKTSKIPWEAKSYYFQSPHNNSTFQTIRMNSKSDMRVPKPPKPPEKPLMPYMRYSRKVWEQVKNSNPHLKLWEVGKIIGQMWRELPDDEKILYVEEYDAEKTQYTELLRQYHSSPAYQAWLVAKERAEKSMEEQDQGRRQSILRSRDRGNELPQGDLRESYILEDNEEDTEDQFTAKHVAAARFQRNHRLMQEVLSDTRLPDPGQLITQSRLNTLRLQVEQLKNHKRNLCQEIEGCEARHQAKVQRIREESERFRLDYQKITTTRPVITESQFADMIIKAKYDMQREEEERKTRYLAELEIRRKRQQQRQQREAELLESERRRQLLHQQQLQQVHMRPNQAAPPHNDPNIQFIDRSLERLITQDKREDTSSQPPQKLPSASANLLCPANHPKAASEIGHEINPGLYAGIGNTFTQPVTQSSSQRFPQSGHTQHHYPPPLHYVPNAATPANPPVLIHQRSPVPHIQQAAQNNTGKPNTVSLGRTKKVPSSASSTSSASSASSTSSKKKKVDSDLVKDAAVTTTSQDMRERPISRSGEGVVDQTKPGDFDMTPGQSNEFQQGSTTQSRQLITSQYQQAPALANPVVPAQISGGPVQTPYCYEIGIGNPPNPTLSAGSYYHQPVSVSNPVGYSHPRPQFSQHTPYNSVQYHPVPPQPSAEHPPPPPMYIQHMPQQSHVPQLVPPMVGPTQHTSSHIPPQQHNSNNWHHGAPPPYSPHYGPPRYPVVGGSVGYPMQTPRNFGPNSSGYSMPHYLVGQNGPQTHPHQNISSVPVSIQDSPAASQPIPAPPPYQQQQQPNSVVSYWPTQQQVPPDYVQSQHPSHYMPGSQTEPVVPNQQTLSSVDNVHPCSTMSVSSADVGMGQMVSNQSQGANIYYQGCPVPPYTHGSNVGPSGFYSVPSQHYTPHQHSGHSWSGYSNSGPSQVPAYPQSQQHTHHQSPQCSTGASYPIPQISTKPDQTVANVPSDNSTSVGASGGSNSRPPSTNDK